MISRRAVVIALGALAATPVRADDGVRAALDHAARTADPAAALRLLAPLSAREIGDRLDLDAARAGLAADVALAELGFTAKDRPPPGGLSALSNGRTIYAGLLRRKIADRIDLAAIGARLDAEHTRLVRRGATLFATVGQPGGSIGDKYCRLFADPRTLYPNDDMGRTAAVADMNATLATIRAALTGKTSPLPPLPPACLDVSVRAAAAGKPGARTLPAPGIAGNYQVDLAAIRRRPHWTLPSVVAHETIPGHLAQLPLEAIADPHPLRLEYTPGFSEGWATYAETLAFRLGWLGRDPRVELGHLHWLLFRCERARVDLAIHRDGADPAKARAMLADTLGEPVAFIDFDTDIARIVNDPGTRVAEAMAWLALADRTQRLSLTALPAFHARALRHGRRRTDRLITL